MEILHAIKSNIESGAASKDLISLEINYFIGNLSKNINHQTKFTLIISFLSSLYQSLYYSGKSPSGKCSVGKCKSWNCPSEKCPFGGLSVRGTVLRGTICQGNVFGELSLGEMSVGEKSVRELSGYRFTNTDTLIGRLLQRAHLNA